MCVIEGLYNYYPIFLKKIKKKKTNYKKGIFTWVPTQILPLACDKP